MSSPAYKEGDIVVVTTDHHSSTTDPTRYDSQSRQPPHQLQKGEEFTVVDVLDATKEISYLSAGNIPNYVPMEKVRHKINVPKQEVGATYRVLSNNEHRMHPSPKRAYLKTGDVLTVAAFVIRPHEEVVCVYFMWDGEPVTKFTPFPLNELEYVSPPETRTREEPKIAMTATVVHEYKAGDWVEVINAADHAYHPSPLLAFFDRRCKKGTKAKIQEIVGDLLFYESFTHADQAVRVVNVRPTTAPAPHTRLYLTLLPFLIGVLNMRALIELMNNDAIIRNSVHALVVSGAACLTSSMAYMTGKTFLTGFGKMGDRRRRIRQEEENRDRELRQEMVRLAIEEANKKGA